MRCSVGVSIFESVPSYPKGTHEIEVVGFGTVSLAEARAMADREIVALTARNGRAHRAEFYGFCTVCKVTGKKPGCKRKACEACRGSGRTAAPEEA